MAPEIHQAHEFQRHVLKENGLVLVDFKGHWCGPCEMLAPLLDQLASEFPSLKVVKVETTGSPLTQAHGIKMLPTLKLFRGGAEVARHDGSPGTLQRLRAFVQPHVSAQAAP